MPGTMSKGYSYYFLGLTLWIIAWGLAFVTLRPNYFIQNVTYDAVHLTNDGSLVWKIKNQSIIYHRGIYKKANAGFHEGKRTNLFGEKRTDKATMSGFEHKARRTFNIYNEKAKGYHNNAVWSHDRSRLLSNS